MAHHAADVCVPAAAAARDEGAQVPEPRVWGGGAPGADPRVPYDGVHPAGGGGGGGGAPALAAVGGGGVVWGYCGARASVVIAGVGEGRQSTKWCWGGFKPSPLRLVSSPATATRHCTVFKNIGLHSTSLCISKPHPFASNPLYVSKGACTTALT